MDPKAIEIGSSGVIVHSANAEEHRILLWKRFSFNPQPDITAYEVAVLLRELLPEYSRLNLDCFPECLRRHMKEI